MKIVHLLLAALLSLGSLQAMAQRQPVPIINHENVPVVASGGRQASAEQVRRAILEAGKQMRWQMSEPSPGRLVGSLNVNNKHTVVVEIPYAGDRYSLLYRDSINMKYKPEGLIHPFYNKWVSELRDAIRIELNKV